MMKLLADAAALPSGTVTFLLTDVEGSTRMWESDAAAARVAVARHHHLLDDAIRACGGAKPLEQGEGDSVVAAFARATDGVRAALLAQQALAGESWPTDEPVRVRMALHSGEADVAADGTYAGAVLNRCARLRALGHGGQVLVSEATRDLAVDGLEPDVDLVDLGAHRLRDLSRPEQVWQLSGPGLQTAFPALRSLDSRPNNLPVQLSTFVGREDDIERAVALLSETRLLTLTGSGGCGKTRLAQRVAGEASARFSDGVWWVELAPVTDADVVPSVIADAIGVRVPADKDTTETLVGHLQRSAVLVVLDNCEHLVSAVAALTDRLLRACPGLSILTTSREPLAVEGEVTWRVPSLPVPPGASEEPDAVRQYDAVRLFIERAVQARPNFAVTNENAPAVAQICHRLDGIPLAIELAAARTRLLPPERIAAELDDRFRLLSGGSRTAMPRQQTLLASVDWSHNLLDIAERALLRRLGVFTGGFTLEAAESVAAFPPLDEYAVFDLLARLVDKSLVQVDDTESGAARYRLLETIRQYAVDRLDDAGEVSTVRGRQVRWAVALAEVMEPGATNAHGDALDRLDLELPNLRAALEWSTSADDCEQALRLVAALAFFWAHRGHYAEEAAWTPKAIAHSPADGHPLLARARWAGAYVRFYAGDFGGAYEQATRALEEARSAADRWCEARCLHILGTSMLLTDADASRATVSDAYDASLETGDRWCEADSLQMRAYTHIVQGNPDAAEDLLERAKVLTDELDNDFQRAWYFIGVGYLSALRGRFDMARGNFERGVELARSVGDPTTELWGCGGWIYQELAAGRPDAVERIVSSLTQQHRDWGALGDALIPGLVAMAEILTTPEQTARTLTELGEALVAGGDLIDGGQFLTSGALAAVEAGDMDAAARAAEAAVGAATNASLFQAAGRTISALAARAGGDVANAELLAHEALAFLVEKRTCMNAADALEVLGGLALDSGSAAEGARLLAAADALRSRTDQRRFPAAQARFEADVGGAATALEQEFDDVWAAGAALSWEEAAAYAQRARGERRRPTFGWHSLTPTELEVVRLAAEGLTNPQIGERLFIGRGTVKTHLAHVFAKLGVANRSELAAEAVRRGAAIPRDRSLT